MARGRMDADGGRVVHREKRARKLAVVVALQNLLVAACLLVTLYVYWNVCRDVHGPVSKLRGELMRGDDVYRRLFHSRM